MRLILAVSADGFLAKGPSDDMSWTGPLDKAVFRLLTLSDDVNVLLAGSRTYDQMPQLPGRRLERLSRGPNGISLLDAAWRWPNAWLIGGPEVAVEALQAGFVSRSFICESQAQLGAGIPATELLQLLPPQVSSIKVGDVRVRIFANEQ